MSARRMSALAVGVVAVVGLGACTNNPSAKAVAKDVVESIGLAPAEETCMLAAIDEYSDAELQEIGEANETVDFSQPDAVQSQGTPALQKFYEDLNDCMNAA